MGDAVAQPNLPYFNGASNAQSANNIGSSLILNPEFSNLSQNNTLVKSDIS
ncbi:hypothetical protein PN451_11450 [Dolichospermum planctonicum CS-1226]|uniref:Uncharacterized protein n=1 Tax=Dolichospermum planctonicum CS-1226 TaxID=3021751 RepID=A0ABT5AHL4_9CYAN|nr:hypothetical protein [Dolichospermum planctonicum]MDB9536432.1 hypothetical protein [Dolichospermum planctonicum CS-1226]